MPIVKDGITDLIKFQMTDTLRTVIIEIYIYLNIYWIIRHPVVCIIYVNIPYWRSIPTNQTIAALMAAFKRFRIYILRGMIPNIRHLVN